MINSRKKYSNTLYIFPFFAWYSSMFSFSLSTFYESFSEENLLKFQFPKSCFSSAFRLASFFINHHRNIFWNVIKLLLWSASLFFFFGFLCFYWEKSILALFFSFSFLFPLDLTCPFFFSFVFFVLQTPNFSEIVLKNPFLKLDQWMKRTQAFTPIDTPLLLR